jgi:RimJ/RimL family protein N-acetyltransferase
VVVRTLAKADVDAALDLFEAVVAEGRWLASEAPLARHEVRARWEDLLAAGDGVILLADDGAEPIGLAAVVGRRTPELGMLVRADRRGRGVGDALLRACVEWARASGARTLVLHVFPHNAAAIALYRKHGFVERGLVVGQYRRRSGERWDALRMEKDLGTEPPAGRGARPR